jgi:hypothetical protein
VRERESMCASHLIGGARSLKVYERHSGKERHSSKASSKVALN